LADFCSNWLAFADYRIPLWVGLCGCALILLGNWLFWRSHRDLGTNWSPTMEIREAHQLVTTGIYRRIRHPMYAALFLLFTGQAMVLPNWLAGFCALVPFTVLYLVRVRSEERMMSEVFGAAYAEYAARTGRLFPRCRDCITPPP
jgi:protein-S-isoprenylcysteine O-methyltransferase Ste14